jgi:diguanylate cyclase (GGDEF)-like protein
MPTAASPRRLLSRLVEPVVIFPIIAALLLAVIWSTTWSLVRAEREAADRVAAASTAELADTYEAQSLRALREIDQTLRFVKYAYESGAGPIDLAAIKDKGLLPPELLFAVSIADERGNIVASTRPRFGSNIAADDYFVQQREAGEAISISKPVAMPNGEWTLRFSRRLSGRRGEFAGVVFLSVAASYFVSGYEPGRLGSAGLLALVGSDGITRARRTGDVVKVGEPANFAAMIANVEGTPRPTSWDGVVRYAATRPLFEFPVAVVTGLSESEQLAPAAERGRTYLWRAALGSVGVLLFVGGLGGLSWKLGRVRRESQAALYRQASYDPLTELANRSLLRDRLDHDIAQAKRSGAPLAAVFLDIDHFKLVNDTFGHTVGDEMLRVVGARLRASVRESDTVARLGGDEFVLVVPGKPTGPAFEADVTALMHKLSAQVEEPFVLAGREVRPTCSMGIAVFPQDGDDTDTLLRNADAAMYRAKELGRNRYQFFTADVHERIRRHVELEASLRSALARGEFELHYQPQVGIRGGEIIGVEALLRWRHPTEGLVYPGRFIAFAEETGLIVPIGKWVLEEACRQNKAWQDEGLTPIPIAVNMSARQCEQPDVQDVVANALRVSGLEARYLELEITESISMADAQQSVPLMRRLKEIGVALSIDDFGTGFSNLGYLRRFPIDRLKIDLSFVREITTDPGSLAISQAIINMSHSLNLEVIAEGVETQGQLDVLDDHDCDFIQGYLFSPPVAAPEFARLLREDRRLWNRAPRGASVVS